MKALIVKLVIYTGASVAAKIYPIKVKDLNLEKGIIKVGEFDVHLPYHLRNNLSEYVNKLINNRDKKDLLFKNYNNQPFTEPNKIGGFYTHKNGISSTIALSKYAIIQMIEEGVDRDTIQDFTGYGDEVYISCKEYVDMGMHEKRAKIIDETLKTSPLFDIL